MTSMLSLVQLMLTAEFEQCRAYFRPTVTLQWTQEPKARSTNQIKHELLMVIDKSLIASLWLL